MKRKSICQKTREGMQFFEIVRSKKPNVPAAIYPIAPGTVLPLRDNKGWAQVIDGRVVTTFTKDEIAVAGVGDFDWVSLLPRFRLLK